MWIVGDMEYMQARGFKPLGMEPVGVGVTSDADHIITPSPDGPRAAMHQALADAEGGPLKARDVDDGSEASLC